MSLQQIPPDFVLSASRITCYLFKQKYTIASHFCQLVFSDRYGNSTFYQANAPRRNSHKADSLSTFSLSIAYKWKRNFFRLFSALICFSATDAYPKDVYTYTLFSNHSSLFVSLYVIMKHHGFFCSSVVKFIYYLGGIVLR